MSVTYDWLNPKKNDSIIMTPRKGQTLAETMRGNIIGSAQSNQSTQHSNTTSSQTKTKTEKSEPKQEKKNSFGRAFQTSEPTYSESQNYRNTYNRNNGIPTTSNALNANAAGSFKIVGDDVTEKDYSDFFEGFRSIYEDDTPKVVPYKNTSNTESRDARVARVREQYAEREPQGTWEDKLKQKREDIQNFGDELARIAKDLPPYIYWAIAATKTALPGSPLRKVAGKVLENEIKKIHYARNQYNVDLPQNGDQAKEWNWETEASNCHQFTAPNGKRYIKYVSPDGKREVIFDSEGKAVITSDEDIGTYNYASPNLWLSHGIADVLPWIVYGNTPEDTTEWYERIGGLFKFE